MTVTTADARGYDTSGNGVIDVADDDSDENGIVERRVFDANEEGVGDGTLPTPNVYFNADGSVTMVASQTVTVDLTDPEAVDEATGVYLDDIERDLRGAGRPGTRRRCRAGWRRHLKHRGEQRGAHSAG